MTQVDATHGDLTSHGHEEGHGHSPHLAHHFDSMQQQVDSGKLGIWLFLATEILMFGGLFCAYAVWRAHHYESFEIGHRYLDTFWGAFNTIVLLVSSFTMAWGVRTAQLGKQKATVILLSLTFLGGVGFMCVKYVEYSHKFHEGLGPGFYYTSPQMAQQVIQEHTRQKTTEAQASQAAAAASTAASPPPAGSTHPAAAAPPIGPVRLQSHASGHGHETAHGGHGHSEFGEHYHWLHTPEELKKARPFFSIYFGMTGLHGLHVLVGMGLIAWIGIRAHRAEFGPEYYAPVDLVGLYWHLVDLIWIFLFPLLYLIA